MLFFHRYSSFYFIVYEKAKKIVQFKENTEVNVMKEELEDVEINEEKTDRLLYLLHEANPTNPEKDTEEMLKLESMCFKSCCYTQRVTIFL